MGFLLPKHKFFYCSFPYRIVHLSGMLGCMCPHIFHPVFPQSNNIYHTVYFLKCMQKNARGLLSSSVFLTDSIVNYLFVIFAICCISFFLFFFFSWNLQNNNYCHFQSKTSNCHSTWDHSHIRPAVPVKFRWCLTRFG